MILTEILRGPIVLVVALGSFLLLASCRSPDKPTVARSEMPPATAVQRDEAVQLAIAHASSQVPEFAKYKLENAVYKSDRWYVRFEDPSNPSFGWPAVFVVVVTPDKASEIVRVNY